MKKLFILIATVMLVVSVFAQAPQKMSYQAVIRNSSDALVRNTQVGMQISILQGSANGAAVYTETQRPTTNANGLVSIEIGAGYVESGSFAAIDWQNGPYFIKTETDPEGRNNYSITGTSQILSVPFALHAQTAETVTGTITETDPVFSAWDKSTGISITESQISDLNHFTNADETDPAYTADSSSIKEGVRSWNNSLAKKISPADTARWNNKLNSESDPEFTAWDKSTGISITESQISDLTHFTNADETDPRFQQSVAKGITAADTAMWNKKSSFSGNYQDLHNKPTSLSRFTNDMNFVQSYQISQFITTESDPVFRAWNKSTGISITKSQISDLGAYVVTETDPVFTAWDKSTGISITESQISDLGTYIETETDPAVTANFDFNGAASGDLLQFNGTKWVKVTPTYISDYTVTETDVTAHQAALTITESQISDLGTYVETETDPVFTAWDKDYADLINTPAAADGSETKVTAGTNVTVTGSGTTASPYVVNATAGSGSTTYSVGDFAQGGIVFWVDETGQHGLVAAKEDQSTGVRWYAGTYGNTQAKGDGPFSGEANTSIIIAAQVAIGDDGSTYAARICNELQVTEGGKTYGDWYLPSKEELNLMYQNKATIDATAGVNGGSGFASAFYWSSSESNSNSAWLQYFDGGFQRDYGKNLTYYVRAVRAF